MKSIAVVLVVVAMIAFAFLLMRPVPPVEQNSNAPAETPRADTPQENLFEVLATDTEQPFADELNCPDYSGPDDPRKSAGDIQNELDSAVVSLQGSGQPEHWLAAAILLAGKEPQTAMRLLQQLRTIESTAKLAAFQMLRLCDKRNRTACHSPDMEKALIRADSDNGVMWVQVASLRLDAGREQDAIEALRRAIRAPRFDTYFKEQIDVLDRGLAAVTGLSYPERVVYGADTVLSKPFSLGGIRSFCQLSDTSGWFEVCNAVGERILVEGGDISIRIKGAELRSSLDENRESPELMASIEDDLERLKAMQSAMFNDPRQLNLVLNDESVMRGFIEAYDTYGEEGAIQELQERTFRLLENPDYDRCNFVSNPFIKM